MPYKPRTPDCGSWWACLDSSEQVAILLGSGVCLTAIIIAIIVTQRGKKP
jgi:hypothetical protein